MSDSLTQTVRFPVMLSEPAPDTDDSVTWATLDGTALAGIDYVAASGRLTFAQGATVGYISVDVLEPKMSSVDKVFYVVLSRSSNLSLTNMIATCTITQAYGTAIWDGTIGTWS